MGVELLDGRDVDRAQRARRGAPKDVSRIAQQRPIKEAHAHSPARMRVDGTYPVPVVAAKRIRQHPVLDRDIEVWVTGQYRAVECEDERDAVRVDALGVCITCRVGHGHLWSMVREAAAGWRSIARPRRSLIG